MRCTTRYKNGMHTNFRITCHESSRETALDVAKHRYARGEVTTEEFERLKRDLT